MTDRDDWLEKRRAGIGGSDVAGILRLSPWSSPFDVWASKTMPLGEDRDNKVQRRGRLLERAVGDYMAEELERTLTPGTLIVHPVHEWAKGTPDFWMDDLDIAREGAEAKTARDLSEWGPSGSGRMPTHVKLQALWYLLVSGVDRWHVGVYGNIADDWRIYTIERAGNEDVLDALLNRIGEWWERHIVQGVVPEIDTSRAAAQYLRRQHAHHNGRMRHAEASDLNLIVGWQGALTMEKNAGTMRKQYEMQLKARIGNNKGLIGNFGRVTWSRYTTQRLDMKRVREELPVVIEGLEKSGFVKTTDAGRLNYKPRKKK